MTVFFVSLRVWGSSKVRFETYFEYERYAGEQYTQNAALRKDLNLMLSVPIRYFILTCVILSGLLPVGAFQEEKPKEKTINTEEVLTSANEYEQKRIAFYRKLPWDGIRVRGLYERQLDGHLVVYMVVPNSPGERAGILPGDIILTMNGEAASDFTSSTLFQFMTSLEIGDKLIYEIERNGTKLTIPVTLSAPTEALIAEWLLEWRSKAEEKRKQEQAERKKDY